MKLSLINTWINLAGLFVVVSITGVPLLYLGCSFLSLIFAASEVHLLRRKILAPTHNTHHSSIESSSIGGILLISVLVLLLFGGILLSAHSCVSFALVIQF